MVVEEGLKAILRFILRDSVVGTSIGLFTNLITIADDTVLADLTEATFPGYAQVPAITVTWPDPAINVDGEAESDGPTIVWECTTSPGSPETIRGIFVQIVDNTATPALFSAYVFPDPVVITIIGDEVAKKLNWFTDNY